MESTHLLTRPRGKMRIAIVRGPFLNKWEMQSYEPLLRRHELSAFATTSHVFALDEITIPVRKLFCADTIPSIFSRKFGSLFNRACNRVFGWNHHMFGLERELRGHDIVHTAELYHTFTNQVMRAKRRHGMKVVVTVWENIPFTFERNHLRRRIKEEVRENADLFIAVTQRAKECLVLEGVEEDRIALLPVGVDLSRFNPRGKNPGVSERLGLDALDLVILFAGRFVCEKGVYDLIYAAKKIINDPEVDSRVKFVFVGDGPEKSGMKKMISRLGISSQVRLVDSVPYGKMPDVYGVGDLFVLPSMPTRFWQEQYGMVLVESMACGKPVLSTHTGSIPEVVGDAGVLVQPGDYLSLYSEMKAILLDAALRKSLGQRALAIAQERYDATKVAEQLEKLYLGVLDR